MPFRIATERWSIMLVVFALASALLLSHWHPARSAAAPPHAAPANLIPVPSEPPTPASIAELQARNKGLHWTATDGRSVMILTPFGSCGTLTGLAPAQISFHTGREYDREPHLYSAWSDAYTAAEQYCETWVAGQQQRSSPAH